MIIDTDLMHAPPRLSDLQGDDLRAALFARHDAARSAWRAQHIRQSPEHAATGLRNASRAVVALAVLCALILIVFIAPPTVRWIVAGAPSASVAHLPATVPTPKSPAVEAGRARSGDVR